MIFFRWLGNNSYVHLYTMLDCSLKLLTPNNPFCTEVLGLLSPGIEACFRNIWWGICSTGKGMDFGWFVFDKSNVWFQFMYLYYFIFILTYMIYVLFVVTFPLGKIWWWAMYDQNKFCWCIADFYLSVCAFAGCSTYAHTIGFFRSWVDESIQKDLKPDLVSFHMQVVQKTCSLPKRIIKVAKWPVWNIACT